MLTFIFLIGLMNMLGGRWADVYGLPTGNSGSGRLIFRCLLPAVFSMLLARELYFTNWNAMYIGAAVCIGSALWFSPGWSFDEISGEFDRTKYPKFIRRIGLLLFRDDGKASTNRRRGMVMKGIRGLFDIVTFALLSAVNPDAMLFWPGCAAMGVVYWACGKLVKNAGHAVLISEFAYGLYRGLLILLAITSQFSNFHTG